MAQHSYRAWICGVAVVLLCFTYVLGEQEDDDHLTLPSDLPAGLPGDIDSPDDVPLISDWKERCRTDVGEQAVKDIEESNKHLLTCVSKLIKWDKLQHEINRSIPRGELDLVFKKYCGRRNELMLCVEDMYSKLNLCMDEQERHDLNITRQAIDAGLNFVCHKEGDRIALFMATKGGECVKSQKDNIRECIEERVPKLKKVEDDYGSISLNDLVISEENCKKVNSMHECVVEWTEKCEDSTPSNILGSLIVQILKVTPCRQTSSAPALLFSAHDLLPRMLTLFAAALTAANILL